MSFSPSNQPFKDDIELKSDLRSDTLDTRQEYDLKVSLFKNGPVLHNSQQILLSTEMPYHWNIGHTMSESTVVSR